MSGRRNHPGPVARLLTRTPIHLALLLIGTVWLVPTVGLLITSFRERADIHADGWWNFVREPRFTAETYVTMLTSTGQTESLFQNFEILGTLNPSAPQQFLYWKLPIQPRSPGYFGLFDASF